MERTLYEYILGHAVQGIAANPNVTPIKDVDLDEMSTHVAIMAHGVTREAVSRMPRQETKPAPPAVLTLREVGPAKYEADRPDGMRFEIELDKAPDDWRWKVTRIGTHIMHYATDFQSAIKTAKEWEVVA